MPDHKWDLSRLSAGERSALKRNSGIMMNSAGADAIEGFYRALTVPASPYSEKAWFAAICMQCLWRDGENPQVVPFPEMLRKIYQNPDATESSRKRCTGFMDLFWDDDGFLLGKICSLVRKMRAENSSVMPDFDELSDDLIHWNHPSRYVQRRWLKIICNPKEKEEKTEEEENHVD